ncbi:MAG: hypothetical protein J5564_02405 [Clostridia bacterium]|nr:hypothetical protein [Clostridia bacterium]
MNKTEIMQKLKELDFDPEDYWLITGSAMVMRGIRDETHDIDLGCSRKLADRLEAKGLPSIHTQDGKRKFVLGPDIEIFEEWLYDRIETVEGIPVISLKGLMEMKESLGREKDKKDIALIRAYMKTHGIC